MTELTHKEKLIQTLEELLVTMEQTKQDNVNMKTWVYDADDRDDDEPLLEFSCGYAACVLGDHIIRTKKLTLPFDDHDRYDIDDLAGKFSETMDKQCRAVFGDYCLTRSIYCGDFAERYNLADYIKAFSDYELGSFKHLTVRNPKTEDVIIYIKACIEKIKQFGV